MHVTIWEAVLKYIGKNYWWKWWWVLWTFEIWQTCGITGAVKYRKFLAYCSSIGWINMVFTTANNRKRGELWFKWMIMELWLSWVRDYQPVVILAVCHLVNFFSPTELIRTSTFQRKVLNFQRIAKNVCLSVPEDHLSVPKNYFHLCGV